ncbi:YrhB domain-containing protein [Streptomyces sp. NRRL S-481]|uniref:YrhB domain-containing protein n=1 Tax=Streptomyces sp. NRRL S-481 TaxID=1463911 RepID=UPI003B63A4BF
MPPYSPEPGVTAVFISMQEHRFGWEFRYQSLTYAKTGNLEDTGLGTGPVVVDRRDGRLQEVGGRQFGDTVAEYQRMYDQQTITDGPRDPCPFRARSAREPRTTVGDHGAHQRQRPRPIPLARGPLSLLTKRRRWDLNPR